MSDLLKRLENRRKQRVRVKTGVETTCLDADKPICPAGQDARCLPDYYGVYRWQCVDSDIPPPPDPCPDGIIVWVTNPTETYGGHYECAPEPTITCPVGYNLVYNSMFKQWSCAPVPVYAPGEPIPEKPVILPSAPKGNVGLSLGQFTGKVTALNILRLRVHMGNEFGDIKGWHTVTFPNEMEQAHVLAASGPRSAAVPVFEVRMARRADYSLKFAQNVANIVLDPIKEIIPNIWPLHEVIDDILKPMVGGLSRVIGEITYDIVVKPTLKVSQEIVNEALPRLPEAWGMDRERSVTTVDIKDITTTSFKWYSYGNMYINWIAIGFLLADEETPLPPEIAGPIEEINRLKDEFNNLKDKFEELKLKIGIEPTEPLIPPILPPPETEPEEPVLGGGEDRIFSVKNIQKRRKKRLERD